ncbi:MAG: 23S rRNA (uracil(1939)-C(5))-methyltransferase RlmD [Pseudomonadota bacterium]
MSAVVRIAQVESLDQEGRGVARDGGKVIFVDGALPRETVVYSPYRRKPTFEFATASQVLRESSMRVRPRCPHFGTCGGCSLQHVEASAQVAIKQRVLEDQLWHIARVRPEQMLPPLHGPYWRYRHRARLTVRHVAKKGGVLVGFHERRSSFVADMWSCEVLPRPVSDLIPALRELVGALSIRERLPQIEVAVGDDATVLVLRLLEPFSDDDAERVRRFAGRHGVAIYVQRGGPETAQPFHPAAGVDLCYRLPEFGVEIGFGPTQFTQVNPAVNRSLVGRAVRLLNPRAGERVADFFCGLGNFALPLAATGAEVTGYEGTPALVAAAEANARRNGLERRTRFETANLFEADEGWLSAQGAFDQWLVDPPRDGAVELVKALIAPGPRRIVYVSCNPATLARDAGVLTQVKGYRLRAAGIVNMFPHTAHVESLAVFERG